MNASFDATMTKLGITRTASGPNVAASGASTLGQADFLKLMTAQMKNQDPFDPVDNTEMVAQMAQFSSLAGISEMSTTLKQISDKLGAASVGDATAYLGRTVLTAGDVAYGREAGGIAGAVELAGAASDLTVTIADANGLVLKHVALGPRKAGTVEYDWDGRTDAGEDAGPGPFTVTTQARNADKAVEATSLVWSPVHSVSTANGEAVLTLPGLGPVPVSAVRKVG